MRARDDAGLLGGKVGKKFFYCLVLLVVLLFLELLYS
jgi:hypothetical protein